ncbi:MAG TPA: hypothetical protein VLV83_02430, partial [Acidobacteriota bacterium]|nr:hypothetical protein [Acidobacteriota bacterium]
MPSVKKLALLCCVLILLSTIFAQAQTGIGFELVAEGLNRPIGIAHAGDGSGRLFVTEGLGRIRVIENGDLLDQPFL